MKVSFSRAKDVIAGRLAVRFQGYSGGWSKFTAARYCSLCVLNAGESPSYALIGSPMNDYGPNAYDEIAPTVALQNTGPAGRILLRSRAQVIYLEGGYSATLMNGWVVSHSHELGEDSLTTQVYDDRWMLSKYTIGGRMVYDPQSGRHYWDLCNPTIFNEMGFPNCIDSPFGPRFAPCHRFGFSNDMNSSQAAIETFTEPEAGYATDRARSWTCADAVRYLRDVYSPSNGACRPPLPVYIGNWNLPDFLIWPETLGNVFGSDRPLKSFSVHNQSLLGGLCAILRKAGAYDLYCEPANNSEFKSTLRILEMNPKDFTGAKLYTAAFAAEHVGTCMNDAAIIKSGMITESFVDGFDEACIAGDGPVVERMVSTYGSGVGASRLENAWASADETAFEDYVDRYGDGTPKVGTQNSFEQACKIWPLVFCAYRIPLSADIWAGTKWAGMKNGGRPRIKPAQLTGYQQDASNPRNWQPREIVVEYLRQYEDEDTTDPDPEPDEWFEAARFDNLTLTADSTIAIVSALREPANSQTWYSRYDGEAGDGTYRGSKMAARPVRIQMALEADFPITGLKGNGGAAEDDPNRIYARVDDSIRWTYTSFAESMDYVEYLRHTDSRPVGQAKPEKLSDSLTQAAFPAKMTEGNELFTDRENIDTGRLPRHADLRNKDVKRVVIHGTLNIEPVAIGIKPGLNLSIDGGGGIPVAGVVKSVTFRADGGDEGQTTVEIGPPDSAAIYDPPVARRGSVSNNSGINTSGSTGGGKTETYETHKGGSQETSSGGDSPYTTPTAKSVSYPESKPSISSYNDTPASAPVDDYEQSSSGKTPGRPEAGKGGGGGNAGMGKRGGQILVDPTYNDIDAVARREIQESAQLLAGKGSEASQGDFEFAIQQRYGKDADTNSEMERLNLGGYEGKKDVGGDFAKKSRGIYKTHDDGFVQTMPSMSSRATKGSGIFMNGERVNVPKAKKGVTLHQ